MKTITSIVLLVLSAALLRGCTTTTSESLNSTLWMQTAAEYQASALQTYNAAASNLEAAIQDSHWTAALEQSGAYAALPVAVVLDAWSRRVVGWAFATHLRVELVLAALQMAVRRRQPRGVIHHSDQGCQYSSVAFGNRCRQAGVRPSMGSVGDAYDNALCESFFATLECELIDRTRLRTPEEAERAVFEFIEGWYNLHRRHSALNYDSPMEYESKNLGVTQTTSPNLSTKTG